MKTVMQELIEILEDKNHLSNQRNNQDDIDTYLHCIDEAKKLLQKEKEQIIEAYCEGFKEGSEGNRIMPEEYYNQTYNQNKLTIKTDGKVGLSNPVETTNNKINLTNNL